MPELPEVETVRRGLEHTVVGRTVSAVEVRHDRAVRRHVPGSDDFAAALAGRTLLAARRRGKFLWLPLDSGDALVAHLGMSGQLVALAADVPDGPHLRVRLSFTDGGLQLRFIDQRTFGGMQVDPGGAELPHPLEHIARDPFDPLFDDAAFARALRSRRTGIKRAMLDQSLVSGIGNMYADEALWRARLHYARPTASLGPKQVRALLAAVREVMTEALAAGGTTFDGLYVNVNGESGYFDVSLDAYGREGEPCRRCGTTIVREAFMNRSSFFCPHCQKPPR
ncbi:MAG: formamidopyrimidine-DNA glycosylase [Frankiales bacterium]|nr:formamidopyrimidine-DNA glycosylase [Frankiales bacterium]